jgi:hypothetical protein
MKYKDLKHQDLFMFEFKTLMALDLSIVTEGKHKGMIAIDPVSHEAFRVDDDDDVMKIEFGQKPKKPK